jgi:hypothetical protein
VTSAPGDAKGLALTDFQIRLAHSSSPCPASGTSQRSAASSSTAPTTCWSTSPWTPHRNNQPPPALSAHLRTRRTRRPQGRGPVRPCRGPRLRCRPGARRHFTKVELLQEAAQVDPGFDQRIFAQMLRSLTWWRDPGRSHCLPKQT